MKFKLDECLDVRVAALLSEAGHEAHTVHQEGLSGSSDDTLYSICLGEEFVLLTQDTGFTNPFRFSLLEPDQVRLSARFKNARLFTRWFDFVRGGKYIVVVVVSESRPSRRHWIVTAYITRKLAGGEIEWKPS
jgi:predicted nuclease of predicted toxin-antitoxin system